MSELDHVMPIAHFDELDSTSLEARRDVESGELGDQARMYVARRQTGGKGRFGRVWESPLGGLWATAAWPINLEPARVIDGLGLRVGMALVWAVEHALAAHGHGDPVKLKWPNDVFVRGKKVAGALTEVLEHNGKKYALVGVGVNLNFPVTALPDELRATATTLQEVAGGDFPFNRFLDDVRARIHEALTKEGLDKKTLVEARQRLYGVGEEATVRLADGSTKAGELIELTDEGRLKLRAEGAEWTAPPGVELLA